MPCVFCLAVLTLVAGSITAEVVDRMAERLGGIATGPVSRTVDTESVARLEFEVAANTGRGRRSRANVQVPVPVAVTVYKQHNRVRIQLLDHAVQGDAARALEYQIASTIGAQIVSRADAHSRAHAHAADHERSPDAMADRSPQPIIRAAQRPAGQRSTEL